ncbi:type II CRISPR RNA-guided endonuclease Cas9 [Lacticaseibacillus mingshuiensis]|uniref:type II CRISPR RNA-guided endonuclease Cas9 n=1 Tax=Lacticaseibacillus mingshuiensis TaxID=2799574 RepID=UPI0019509ADA|nr:type II CRISPR RNA-guided endonuclease Cas9 [Lacticaseibacillus mingshuiensis]
MGQTKEYGIGLDIGTSSIGISAVDGQGKLLNLKGKKAYSVYLYSEGQAAATRRQQRTTRRRLKRRRRRLGLLRELFRPMIEAQDPEFFLRQKYFGISPRDKDNVQTAKRIFNDRTDKDFYDQYPTIYHLRHALMTKPEQFDIREVYLAVRHIIKYRGHFLTQGNAKDFDAKKIDFSAAFATLDDCYQRLIPDSSIVLSGLQYDEISLILLDNNSSRADRRGKLVTLLMAAQTLTDKDEIKQVKQLITELANGILGLKTKFNVLVNVEGDGTWNKSFDAFDDFFADHGSELSDDAQTVLETVQELYRSILLAGIIPAGTTYSEHMIERYEKHKEDLKLFKAYLATLEAKKRRELRALYDQYIDGKDSKPLIRDEFYKQLSKAIAKDDSEMAQTIKDEIVADNFLPKLRTKDNGAIPYQVQQRELDVILANQGKYYPWLVNPNPVEAHRSAAPYQIDELITFRVPYYGGPMITEEDQRETSGAKFAWMVRRESGEITPWNYEQKVDKPKTAAGFIARMKTTDTYLLGEDVVPKQSLLYQRYEVLNELNMIRVEGQPLTATQKQRLYVELFQNRTKNSAVTAKKLRENLVTHGEFPPKMEIKIEGLSNGKSFLSGLSSYHRLRQILPEAIDDPSRQEDLETIIAWATIFEDSNILRDQLQTINWLTDDQRQSLGGLRLRGWGQFSKKLLAELKDSRGKTVIQELWDTQQNFMHIISDDQFKRAIDEANQGRLSPSTVDELLDEAYTSPSNKKAIRKVMTIIADIKRANGGYDPTWLFLETADGPSGKSDLSRSRRQQVATLFDTIASDVVRESVREEFHERQGSADFSKDRLFLYFMQNGVDLYTGEKLNIDNLAGYDIDHIIPQAITKDDSLANRVLVSQSANREKGDRLAFDVYGPAMQWKWRHLSDDGFIPKNKLANLMLRQSDFDKRAEGFIARQLVETRQIIKLTEQIAAALFPDTKIIAVKAGLTQGFRHAYGLPKNRDVNDYHHAFDSYLAAWIGLYLLNRYPKLTPFFVYGDYSKAYYKDIRQFNFIAMMQKNNLTVTNESGAVVWGGPQTISDMKRIYEYKHVTTVHEVLEGHGALYDATRYPASDAARKSLIPLKANLPVEIYGGYAKEAAAYLSLVRLTDKTPVTYKIFSISIRDASLIAQQVKNSELSFRELIYIQLKQEKFLSKSNFEVVIPKLALNNLFHNKKYGYFLVRSDKMFRNYQQLWLSLADQKRLQAQASDTVEPKTITKGLDTVFEKIVDQSDRFFNLYDIRANRAKLSESIAGFNTLQANNVLDLIGLKRMVISQVLTGLHANPTALKVPDLGITTPFGFLQNSSGVNLANDTEIIYQSPSGMFEKRIPLSSL